MLDSLPTVMESGITSKVPVLNLAICFTGISTTRLSSAFLYSGLSNFALMVSPQERWSTPGRDKSLYLSSVTLPGGKEFKATEEEPDSVVNTALSDTFSDSMEKSRFVAPMSLEAFLIFKISSNSSPAMMVSGMVVNPSTIILALVRSCSLNSPYSSSLSLL